MRETEEQKGNFYREKKKLQMRRTKEKENQWHTPIRGLIPCKE
jgi:hypothetical protein